MFNHETDSVSLTNFTSRTSDYLTHLHETGSPLVLTVDGKAEVVVQDAGCSGIADDPTIGNPVWLPRPWRSVDS